MNYLRNWPEVQSWMNDNGIKRFFVSRSGEGGQDNKNVFTYDTDKSEAENLIICERNLQGRSGEVLYITGWRTEKARTGGFSHTILYDRVPEMAPAPVSGGMSIGAVEIDRLRSEIKREIQNEYEATRLQREREEFQRERSQFESDKAGVMGVLVEYLAPVAQQLMGIAPKRVAGLDATSSVEAAKIRPVSPEVAPEETEEDSVFTDEENEKLFDLLSRFKAVEPDYLSLIERVVEMAESGDSMYNMAKGMLL